MKIPLKGLARLFEKTKKAVVFPFQKVKQEYQKIQRQVQYEYWRLQYKMEENQRKQELMQWHKINSKILKERIEKLEKKILKGIGINTLRNIMIGRK